MRTDLPWNVAGIPPDAREAARAAARREGMSVGEWLTRQITRNSADAGGTYEPGRMAWPGTVPFQHYAEEPAVAASFRENHDMLARVSRSESETQNAYRKIEDHLRSLARRLDSAERAQSDNSQVLNQAANEINLASREQSQAFDALGSHVVALGERIDRLEQSSGSDSTKDVVRGLQDGLSRIADQLSETANQSASQITALATTMEAVVNKMSDVHDQAAKSATTLGQRIGLVDDRVHAIETTIHVKGEAVDRAIQRLEQHKEAHAETIEQAVAEIEDRHSAIRSEVRQSIQNLDNRYQARREELQNAIDATRTAHEKTQNEVHRRIDELETQFSTVKSDTAESDRRAEQLQRLEETIEQLTARVAAHELQSAGTMTRLEEGFARIEGQHDNSLDRRVYGVERGISDLVERLEAAERHASAMSSGLEEQLRSLGGKIEDFDRNTREAISELHHSVKDTSSRLEVIEGVPASPEAAGEVEAPVESLGDVETPVGAVSQDSAVEADTIDLSPENEKTGRKMPEFDMPPFDEPVAPAFQDSAIHRAFGQRHTEFVPATSQDEDIFREETPLAAEEFGPHDEANESFLSAARRSAAVAAAAAQEEPMTTTLGGFTWGARRDEPETDEQQPRSRAMLIGGIALVAILAIGAGVALSFRLGGHKILAPAPTPVEMKHSVTTAPSVHSAPAPDTALVPQQSQADSSSNQTAARAKPKTAVSTGDRLATLADGGNAKAQLLLGLKYLDGDGVAVNEAVAAKWLQRAADQGEPIAQYRLGTLYERGHGVATDAAKAMHWYEAAARQGNRKAMHNLAVAYAEGRGTTKNFVEAARWFSRAATLGLADSQFNLAVLYERGLGVPQSLTDAYKWYAIAATQGDNESKARIAALATQLTPADHEAAQKAADAFRPTPLNRAANVPPETPGRG